MSGVDHISPIPDSILHDILSSFPTEEVMMMRSVSKRWRSLCASMPHLRFFSSHFPKRPKRFELFVSTVLLRLCDSSNIETLEIDLSWYGGEDEDEDEDEDDWESVCDKSLPGTWITAAVERNVQHLDLNSFTFTGEMSRRLFNCQSLVTLRLEECEIDSEDLASVCLGKLRTLDIEDNYVSSDYITKLVSGCPVLQHLILTLEFFGSNVDLDISSLKLETLNLIVDYGVEMSDDARFTITLELPSLISLCIDVPEGIDSLKMINALHNICDLELNSCALEYLFGEIVALKRLPTFSSLKKLTLTTCLSDGPIKAITGLLQCSPSLEKLVIRNCKYPCFSGRKWVLKESSEDFPINLKLVEIHGFKSEPSRENFVKLLLSKAKARKGCLSIIYA